MEFGLPKHEHEGVVLLHYNALSVVQPNILEEDIAPILSSSMSDEERKQGRNTRRRKNVFSFMPTRQQDTRKQIKNTGKDEGRNFYV